MVEASCNYLYVSLFCHITPPPKAQATWTAIIVIQHHSRGRISGLSFGDKITAEKKQFRKHSYVPLLLPKISNIKRPVENLGTFFFFPLLQPLASCIIYGEISTFYSSSPFPLLLLSFVVFFIYLFTPSIFSPHLRRWPCNSI